MPKRKNTTAHNRTYKAHRNGIKKPARQYKRTTLGMDQKFLRNQRWATKHRIEAEAKN
ncbi:60S ribosomal protein L29 [Carpediemonas membranifera]|uniref:60S ribosomal protein L29 n=1 Tax=Carpediemonas membranifera TaxID=201153 RepID=A0A8J6EBI3_9EUKA|nr:60S ribosomal protein L29 [Carpediemonas membranifera]|eukprot:KAG9397270.1 60S ribosomal protein L29 [Carpediemonas membranifera]